MSFAPSSPAAAAMSGSRRSRASDSEPGRSGRRAQTRRASASSPLAHAATNCSSSARAITDYITLLIKAR